jgi:hypothetical protein
MAQQLRIMQDEKNGAPRASYCGVVVVRVGHAASVRLIIARAALANR